MPHRPGLAPAEMGSTMRVFFGFFLVSGFCSLIYEVVWLRLAMAQLGVTTPMVSIVLSVFMAGLAFGSWGAGVVARRFESRGVGFLIRLYAVAELTVAASLAVVPGGLARGRSLLAATVAGNEWGSGSYHLASGLWVLLVLLPFCVSMGATFPLAMGAIRTLAPERASRSFSYLYVANVAGATAGTLASAFVLIELLGFTGTLRVAATLNALLAAAAVCISMRTTPGSAAREAAMTPPAVGCRDSFVGSRIPVALFATGLVSMAMELIWVRQFTPYLGNVVYTFALILATYLVATFVGSRIYRWMAQARPEQVAGILGTGLVGVVGFLGVLPLVTVDYRLPLPEGTTAGLLRVLVGIGPLCAALGFVTPLLLDRWSSGDPQRAGTGYAINTVGCILGPLLAGFVLLPVVGERWALLGLSLPALVVGLLTPVRAASGEPERRPRPSWAWAASAAATLIVVLTTVDFESHFPGAVVRRDSTATVTASGAGMQKRLLVNGIGMTALTPITKMMAHLPLAHLSEPATSALTICFGMGTSFRSTLSWGVRATSVELVPSVPSLFPFFHADAAALLALPNSRVVLDDGRRFLERSAETYDAIIIDPPPPTEASGSSLLYSRQFYETARTRLRPGGILQQWIPGGERPVVGAFVSAIRVSFPHVRAFVSQEGWGLHILASAAPIPWLDPEVLANRLPATARQDLIEWGPAGSAAEQFAIVLAREAPLDVLTAGTPQTGPLDDDRPINEYYVLRRFFAKYATAGLQAQ